ncbi:MAG: type II toxin-antitoxin system MqsA family antitoxin [bacterium]|nr:type II toxin-antitoxin system MqsA family antitoxin [bacterium]
MGTTETKRKCLYCKGIMKDDHCNHMIDLDGRFIIIRNVPCHKCTQCGEVSYSGEVVAQIEKIVARLKDAYTEVAVVEYAAA